MLGTALALGGLAYAASENGWFDKISDGLSGYTSANAANRFAVANMALQQQYNQENMALEDMYQRSLMADSPSIQRKALEKAGFNPLLAVGGGISSPNSAAHASMPSASGPQVNNRIGDLINGISTVASVGNTISDMVLKSAQTQAARASSAESAARTIKTMKESDSIDPQLEKDLKRYPGRLGHESLALRNGVTAPIFNIVNSAWSATKDWVQDDIKATGRQLNSAKESINDWILKQDVGRGKHR